MQVQKMAYDIRGIRVPHNSKTANVKITVRGDTFYTEHRGLPFIEVPYYGGSKVVYYLPKPLKSQIESDISGFELPIQAGILFSLPFPEENAISFARKMERHYRGMPPATDNALLSSRMSW